MIWSRDSVTWLNKLVKHKELVAKAWSAKEFHSTGGILVLVRAFLLCWAFLLENKLDKLELKNHFIDIDIVACRKD